MPELTSVHPVTDITLWLRFLLGCALVLWLPGYFVIGRHLRHHALPLRVVIAVGLGALLLPLWAQATSLFGFGIRPLEYLPVALALGFGLGFTPKAREFATAIDAAEPPPRWLGAALGLSTMLVFACIAAGFRDFVVPPSTHDAANHAFMTLRITESGSVLASEVFGAPYGRPDLPYAMGLHAIASMLAQTTGLAPYVSVWFLAIAAISLLPISLAILWSEWRLPPAAIGLAGLFVAASPFVPARMLWWGLFGTAMGLFLVPLCALFLERFWSTGRRDFALAAGAGAGSLMLIHGSEVPIAGLVALATILLERRPPVWNALSWVLFFAVEIACGWHFIAEVVPAYLSGGIEPGNEFFETFGLSLDQSLGTLGAWPGLRILGIVAILLGLTQPRTRTLSLFAIGLLLVVTALGLWRDPVSSLLTTPFYRQPERTRYIFVFFMPGLMGAALVWGWQHLPLPRLPSPARIALALGVVGLLVAPELPGIVEDYETKREFAPFSVDDFEHARRLELAIGPEDWVVNQFFDGSSWAMHLSGRRFLVPTGWQMTPPDAAPNRKTLRQIQRGRNLEFLDPRFRYLYVSDLRTGRPRGFIRRRVEQDPRFTPVLVGKHSTLYLIRRAQRR